MKSKTVSIAGLDLGAYAVKCVEMTQTKEGIRIQRAAVHPYYPSDPLAQTLSKVWNPSSSIPSKVRISVSGPSLLIRRISLPSMTHTELKGAIRFEAERHIPFAIDDCILDFQILGQAANKKTMTVLLAAAKRDFIIERLKAVQAAGIEPEVVDVDIFCVANAFAAVSDQADTKTYALLNIGHKGSSLTIIHDKTPFFVREIPLGGLAVTRALAELKSIPEPEAEKLKTDRSAENLADLKSATQKGFDGLVEEVKQSINYFENEAGEDVKHLWLSGGGALSCGATEILTEELNLEAALWPIKKVTVDGPDAKLIETRGTELAVALGMTIRGLGSNK